MSSIQLYDTTLRDGCQAEDITFTLEDKLRIAERLDAFGIHYIEGGWPGSNPRDASFFEAVRRLQLRHAKVAAFGSTRRHGVTCDQDQNVRMLLAAETPVVTIVGRTWDVPVEHDLRVPLAANLEIIADTVGLPAPARRRGDLRRRAFLRRLSLRARLRARLPEDRRRGGGDAPLPLRHPRRQRPGVRRRGDARRARRGRAFRSASIVTTTPSSRSPTASPRSKPGAVQVQGVINGFGERCGNANLCSIVANLQLKLGYDCVPAESLATLQALSHFVDELANREPDKRQAYVGLSAFAHKGGLHVAAVQRRREIYEHIDPALVGNHQRVLLSDLSGRSNIVYKAREFGVDLDSSDPAIQRLLTDLKELESRGYQFEGAEASFELLMQRALHGYERRFRLIGFRVIDEKRIENEPPLSEATIMLAGPDGKIEHTAATGNGPVQALDGALRKALIQVLPGDRGREPPRLQGARARLRRRHRRDRPRADRVGRPTRPLGNRGRLPQPDRGELAGARRFAGLQALQGRQRGGAPSRYAPPAAGEA